ncbi:MAG: hypothetical protein AAGJ67_01830 [Pseudomonadota bacterium]
MRAAGLLFLMASVWGYFYVTQGVISDYQDILHYEPQVQISLLALWMPLGFLGALVVIIVTLPIAIFTGKPARAVIGERWTPLITKLCLYSALVGVASAIALAYHSIDLLGQYGYVYSSKMTQITPTGIHLVYVRSVVL